jgi:N-acylneuraminate cytidylyltransferase
MKPFVLGAVFARGGSKGIPQKNIKELCGKPLIAYAIEAARAVKGIDDVIVSTDDPRIAEVARQYGANVPFTRPAELATDTASEILAWKHAVKEYGRVTGKAVDVLVSVPATSPLREAKDVLHCLDRLLSTDADVVLTVTEPHRNPYFNMVRLDAEGNARVVMDGSGITRRQDAPAVFDITTVAYAVRAPFLLSCQGLMEGRVKTVTVPKERSLDIDDPLDFELAEFYLRRKGVSA